MIRKMIAAERKKNARAERKRERERLLFSSFPLSQKLEEKGATTTKEKRRQRVTAKVCAYLGEFNHRFSFSCFGHLLCV